MKRREFIAGLGGAVVWPLAASAQQQTKPTVAWLDGRPGGPYPDLVEGFRQGLAEVGFSEGRDVTIEYHRAGRTFERLRAVAADLVFRRPAAILAVSAPAALAAKAAARDIPIIFIAGNDPVELGLAASLNRPSGNLTGIVVLTDKIIDKRLELLHNAVPGVETIALLIGPADNPFEPAEVRNAQSAARTLGLHLLVFNITSDAELTAAFSKLVEQRAGAILAGGSETVDTKRDQILSKAARFVLCAMFAYGRDARAGGLFSYGPDAGEINRQAGVYTGRILKGEKPADLPIIQPTKFEFVINLKTAKALGLNLPPTLLAIADEVIE